MYTEEFLNQFVEKKVTITVLGDPKPIVAKVIDVHFGFIVLELATRSHKTLELPIYEVGSCDEIVPLKNRLIYI